MTHSRLRSATTAIPMLAALFAVATVGLANLTAQQKSASLEALRRAFHPAAEASTTDRAAALDGLGNADDRAIASGLLQAFRQLDFEIGELEAEHLAMNRALHGSIEIDPEAKKRGGANARRQLRQRLRVQSIENRDALDPKRLLRRKLVKRIEALRDPAALSVLAQRGLQGKKTPLHARLAAARAVGRAPGGSSTCTKALRKAKDPAALMVALCGMEHALQSASREAIASTVPALQKALGHESAAVRELAARCLAVTRSPDAIPLLIELLAHSRGELQQRTANLLAIMTGSEIGPVAPSWRAWWQDHEPDVRSGATALNATAPASSALGTGAIRRPPPPPPQKGKGRGKRRPGQQGKRKRGSNPPKQGAKPAASGTTYMGIPQNGSSIVYVVDASLSMKVAVDFNVPGLTIAGGGDATRLDACKAELLRALAGLLPDQKFNIVYFHETAGRFRPEPVFATHENVNAARTFVRNLKMKFATNIHDGLFEAFADLAPDVRGRPLGDGIDTVFLLTDGQPANLVPPSLRQGKRGLRGDSAQKLLAMIDDADPLDRVVLHCIGIGRGLNQRLLRSLAAARGGIAKFY